MSNEERTQDKIVLIGTVIESLPDTHFRVQLEDGVELDSYGGKPKLIRRK